MLGQSVSYSIMRDALDALDAMSGLVRVSTLAALQGVVGKDDGTWSMAIGLSLSLHR